MPSSTCTHVDVRTAEAKPFPRTSQPAATSTRAVNTDSILSSNENRDGAHSSGAGYVGKTAQLTPNANKKMKWTPLAL
jgi:hypothetical protein